MTSSGTHQLQQQQPQQGPGTENLRGFNNPSGLLDNGSSWSCVEAKKHALAAVILEEWLHELAAIAQEHSVLQREQDHQRVHEDQRRQLVPEEPPCNEYRVNGKEVTGMDLLGAAGADLP